MRHHLSSLLWGVNIIKLSLIKCRVVLMETILLRANGTLIGGLIRCTHGLGEILSRMVEVLEEVFLPRDISLVTTLVEEVILPTNIFLLVVAFHPRALLPGEVLVAEVFHLITCLVVHPKALLLGEVLVVDGFHMLVLLREEEDFHPKVPLMEALVVEVLCIKVPSILFTRCNQDSHFWLL